MSRLLLQRLGIADRFACRATSRDQPPRSPRPRNLCAMWNRYDGPIIDPHHHLWDLSLERHPWLAPDQGPAVGNIDAIRRDYLVEDYLADSRHQNVVASVHVEAGWTDNDAIHVRQRFSGRGPVCHFNEGYETFKTIVAEFSGDEQRALFFRDRTAALPRPGQCDISGGPPGLRTAAGRG